jgi:predicted aspartyl protease
VPQSLVSNHFPYVPVTLRVAGEDYALEALLDTGFDGAIVVPPGVIQRLPSKRLTHWWMLADGTRVEADVFVGAVEIGGTGSSVVMVTEMGDQVLIGRAISNRFLVTLDHGRTLTFEP